VQLNTLSWYLTCGGSQLGSSAYLRDSWNSARLLAARRYVGGDIARLVPRRLARCEPPYRSRACSTTVTPTNPPPLPPPPPGERDNLGPPRGAREETDPQSRHTHLAHSVQTPKLGTAKRSVGEGGGGEGRWQTGRQ
jgi:hypothetical protein